jgi:RHS repeat-associated protein
VPNTRGVSSVICEYTEPIASSTPAYAKSYQYAGSRLLSTSTKASSTTATTEFHHPDRLGTKLVTNGGSGSWYQQSTLPFGTAFNAESSGYSSQVFTSYDRSTNTGLDYAVNRTYSSGQSRFTQVDPIGMAAASLGNPQSNNLYSYVQNMPTDFVDPSGLNASPGYVVCFPDRYDEKTATVYAGQCYIVGGGGTVGGGITPRPIDPGPGGGGNGGGGGPADQPMPPPDVLRRMIVSRLDANNERCRNFLDGFREKAGIKQTVEQNRSGIEGHRRFASGAFESLSESDRNRFPLPMGSKDEAFSNYFSRLMNEFCRPNI